MCVMRVSGFYKEKRYKKIRLTMDSTLGLKEIFERENKLPASGMTVDFLAGVLSSEIALVSAFSTILLNLLLSQPSEARAVAPERENFSRSTTKSMKLPFSEYDKMLMAQKATPLMLRIFDSSANRTI